MRLKWFRVREFQSVKDSGIINTDTITSLVGKNEAGKSVLLQALYRLRPYVAQDGNFNVARDYPRLDVEDYRIAVEDGKRKTAIPIQACFELEETDLTEAREAFGKKSIIDNELTIDRTYDNTGAFILKCDEKSALNHLIDSSGLTELQRASLKAVESKAPALLKVLRATDQTPEVMRLTAVLSAIEKRGVNGYIYDTYLTHNVPRFLYFSDYYQMTGRENIEALIQREAEKQLRPSDHPLLGLIRLARLKLYDLLEPQSTLELKNKLEGASNYLTRQAMKYWSQNKNLRIMFDVRPAQAGDPEEMREGTNIWGLVSDTRYHVTTELSTRSSGFVWFFSFLAWYTDIKRTSGPLILLLDEPGMTLHAKAQADLLRFFQDELKENHQLIYTTHSPYMIDPEHIENVRIVQDRSIDANLSPEEAQATGTVVLTDIAAAHVDSLIPLQGALGSHLLKSFFEDESHLVVEGLSDLFYLQAMSAYLADEGMAWLDPQWKITPLGGAAQIPMMVSLLGLQHGAHVATLLSTSGSEVKVVDFPQFEKLMKKTNLFSYAEFSKTPEAGAEDLFGEKVYLDIVNAAYADQMSSPIALSDLPQGRKRLAQRVAKVFEQAPLHTGQFEPFIPAQYFAMNIHEFRQSFTPNIKQRFAEIFKSVNRLLK